MPAVSTLQSGSAAPSLISTTAFLAWLSEVDVSSSPTREVPPHPAARTATASNGTANPGSRHLHSPEGPPPDYSRCRHARNRPGVQTDATGLSCTGTATSAVTACGAGRLQLSCARRLLPAAQPPRLGRARSGPPHPRSPGRRGTGWPRRTACRSAAGRAACPRRTGPAGTEMPGSPAMFTGHGEDVVEVHLDRIADSPRRCRTPDRAWSA